jgi:sporulation protein YlmC with PRC-barrel domain
MDLVRDCLDKQLVDRNGHNMGRVDAVILELEEGKQPVVAYIEVGAVSQFERLHRGSGRIVKAISKRWGVARQDPFHMKSGYRIPWNKIDFTDPEKPKITCSVDELPRLEAS